MPIFHGKQYMNPSYGRAIADATGDDSDPRADTNQPIGTAASGYAGPENGPCRCANCIHFECTQSSCDHPVVMADDEIKKLPDGLAQVHADGYCDYFRPAEASRHSERAES